VPTIQIQELRVTLIWVETNLALLANVPPRGAPWLFLGRPIQYARKFDDVRGGKLLPSVLTLPWDKAESTSFWTYYSEGRLGSIKGATAWNLLVPLRRKLEPVPVVPKGWGRFHCDGFFYPHGLGLTVTAVRTAPAGASLTLDEAVAAAFAVREQPFEVQWPGQGAVPRILDRFALENLAALRQTAFGPNAAEGDRPMLPFTIVTVIRGVGSDQSADPATDADLAKALWGLASWDKDYHKVRQPDLNSGLIHIRTSPPNHILYGRKRSRVVWFPTKFADSAPSKPSLSCYHRNLSFNSLQIESLGGLIAATAAQMRTNLKLVAWSQSAAALNASKVLARAYGGKGTYASWSSHVQIVDNALEDDLDYVRTTSSENLPALNRAVPSWSSPASSVPAPPAGAAPAPTTTSTPISHPQIGGTQPSP
jgi:hypothetical protein